MVFYPNISTAPPPFNLVSPPQPALPIFSFVSPCVLFCRPPQITIRRKNGSCKTSAPTSKRPSMLPLSDAKGPQPHHQFNPNIQVNIILLAPRLAFLLLNSFISCLETLAIPVAAAPQRLPGYLGLEASLINHCLNACLTTLKILKNRNSKIKLLRQND